MQQRFTPLHHFENAHPTGIFWDVKKDSNYLWQYRDYRTDGQALHSRTPSEMMLCDDQYVFKQTPAGSIAHFSFRIAHHNFHSKTSQSTGERIRSDVFSYYNGNFEWSGRTNCCIWQSCHKSFRHTHSVSQWMICRLLAKSKLILLLSLVSLMGTL